MCYLQPCPCFDHYSTTPHPQIPKYAGAHSIRLPEESSESGAFPSPQTMRVPVLPHLSLGLGRAVRAMAIAIAVLVLDHLHFAIDGD